MYVCVASRGKPPTTINMEFVVVINVRSSINIGGKLNARKTI